MKRVLAVSLLIIAAATIAFGQCSDADKKKLEDFDRAWGEASVRGDSQKGAKVNDSPKRKRRPIEVVGEFVSRNDSSQGENF